MAGRDRALERIKRAGGRKTKGPAAGVLVQDDGTAEGFGRIVAAGNPTWTLLFEWPWCSTCGCYTWEHSHIFGGTNPYAEPVGGRDVPVPWASDLKLVGAKAGDGPDEVRRAYRATIFREHPDRGGAEAQAKRVIAAYDRLRARGLTT